MTCDVKHISVDVIVDKHAVGCVDIVAVSILHTSVNVIECHRGEHYLGAAQAVLLLHVIQVLSAL